MRKALVTQRTLTVRHGNEGPRHDPYSYTELTMRVTKGGRMRMYRLHYGLATFFERDGIRVKGASERRCLRLWQQSTGLTPGQFEAIYEKLTACPSRCPGCHKRLATHGGYVGEAIVYCPNPSCDTDIVWCQPVTDSMIR